MTLLAIALAIQKIRERFRGGHAVDFQVRQPHSRIHFDSPRGNALFQDVISRFTLDSATEFLFGACVNSLHSDLPYAYNDAVAPQFARAPNVAERFSAAFAGAQNVISMRTRVGWFWHLQELLHDRSAEHMRVVDEFLQPILEEAIAKNRAAKAQMEATGEKGSEEDETLLDHLVKLTDG